jgi:hypothetical protein
MKDGLILHYMYLKKVYDKEIYNNDDILTATHIIFNYYLFLLLYKKYL